MKISLLQVMVLLSTFTFTSCLSIKPTLEEEATTYTVGENITFELPSNPSTGYNWEIIESYDIKVLELISSRYIRNEPIRPGNGGTSIFVFKIINRGSTTLKLVYKRPWDKYDNLEDGENVVLKHFVFSEKTDRFSVY